MSKFTISVEQIDTVLPHPNADRLELASLVGMTFQFCVVKDFYKSGDKVVYFPVDSVVPENVLSLIDLEGKLSGAQKNRVKTIKLRSQISQGIVVKPNELYYYGVTDDMALGTDLTELLGVVKYEPEPVSIRDGRLVPLPQLVHKYDIEGADRYPNIIQMLMDEEVVITEKIEGSHFSASYYADGDYAVCQRNYRILANEGALHDWHKAAQEIKLQEKIITIFSICGAKHVITLRGELIGPGVQGNIYGLSKRRIVFFEMEVDGIPVPPLAMLGRFYTLNLETVPVLYTRKLRDVLEDKSVQEFSNGYTILPGSKETLREGIVIRPINEIWDTEFGRVLLKQRSPEYLAGEA